MNDRNWLEQLNLVEAERQRWHKIREAEAHRRMREIDPNWEPVDRPNSWYWRNRP